MGGGSISDMSNHVCTLGTLSPLYNNKLCMKVNLITLISLFFLFFMVSEISLKWLLLESSLHSSCRHVSVVIVVTYRYIWDAHTVGVLEVLVSHRLVKPPKFSMYNLEVSSSIAN